MKRITPRKQVLGSAAILGLLAGSAGIGLPWSTASAADVATVYVYTGAAQTYVVPGNVCSVSIVALGAQGGAGSPWNGGMQPGVKPIALHAAGTKPDADPAASGEGGLGGEASSTIAVSPGDTMLVSVGGMGGDGAPNSSAQFSGPGAAGWNGGGAGGDSPYNGGGGGGGASDVRLGGTTPTDRVVVAGGGGGTGGYVGDPNYDPQPIGGSGGNPATKGGDGQVAGNEADATVAGGGGPGTSAAGGAGGAGTILTQSDPNNPQINGLDGALALGGTGAGQPSSDGNAYFDGGGGGGGGLYGGGGGGAGYQPAGGGGGGSSLGISTTAGVQAGNGQVTITALTGTCIPPTTTSTTTTSTTTTAPPTTTSTTTTVPPTTTSTTTTVPPTTTSTTTTVPPTTTSTTTTVAPITTVSAPQVRPAAAVQGQPTYTG